MSKFADYLEAKNQLDSAQAKVEALRAEESVQKALRLHDELDEVMKKYGATQKDVLAMWGVSGSAPASDKRRASRPLKTYKNPHTGETVQTRGGNQKTLNAWREQYGKDAVDSWLV